MQLLEYMKNNLIVYFKIVNFGVHGLCSNKAIIKKNKPSIKEVSGKRMNWGHFQRCWSRKHGKGLGADHAERRWKCGGRVLPCWSTGLNSFNCRGALGQLLKSKDNWGTNYILLTHLLYFLKINYCFLKVLDLQKSYEDGTESSCLPCTS